MRSFNRNMGVLAGIFFLMIVVSVSVGTSYIESNNLNSSELWNQTANLDYSDNWEFEGILSGNKASDYSTKELTQSDVFEAKDEIFISSSIEEITFIEENRDDIQVDYYREYPDSDDYRLSYEARETNRRINITATLNIRGLAINKVYDGEIVVRIPKDYRFEKITIDSGAAVIESDNIYTDTDELKVIASFGDMSMTIDHPIETLDIQCSMGSIDLTVKEDVESVDVECNLGEVNLIFNGKVDELEVQNDMGDIYVETNGVVNKGTLNTDLGSVTAKFTDEIKALTVNSDMGSIDLDFYENDDMVLFADTDMGSVDSDFPVDEDASDFRITSSMGSININNK